MLDPDAPPADVNSPTLIEALKGQRVTELSVGYSHNIVGTESHQLFTWGAGAYGRLGHGNCSDVFTPKLVAKLNGGPGVEKPILLKKVAAGAKHTMAIVAQKGMLSDEWQNAVYSWGSGWWYKLGHKDQENKLEPEEVGSLGDKRIIEISAGVFHSAAVSSTGDVYTWGYGAHGRLGHDDYHNQEEPRVVKALRGVDRRFVTKIACGDAHTVAVTDDGRLVVWGKGKYGQLGTADTNECQRPFTLNEKERFVSVSCGANHSMAMTATNEIFTWGMGGSGRLGHGELGDVLKPQVVIELSMNKSIILAELAGQKALEDGISLDERRRDDLYRGEQLSISVLQQLADAESTETEDLVKQDADHIRQLKRDVDVENFRNASLEREVRTIDKKIKLLVKNKKQVQNRFRANMISSQGSPISSLKEDYENLFYLLQNEPNYMAGLTSAAPDEHELLVKALTCLYGNEADPREEILLLKYFELAIDKEFVKADKVTTAFSGVNAMSAGINYFLRRDKCLGALKSILATPLSTVMQDRSDFELNILAVYKEVCQSHNILVDASTTTAQAMRDPEVVNLLVQRAQVLRDYAKTFLDAIVDGIDLIPYGIRCICKNMINNANKYFPHADESQKTSMLASLIFMHWILPAIVTPEMSSLVDGEVLPRVRRHLIMIAKVLHNLCNEAKFEDKLDYMPVINDWINESKVRMKEFLTNATIVEELDQHKKADQYAGYLKQDALQIRIAVNDCFDVHRCLFNSLVVVAPSLDDPLRVILRELGVPPGKVPPAQNKGINLKLVNRFDAPLEDEADGSDSLEAIMQDTRWQLTRILREMAPVDYLQDKYAVDPTNLALLLSKAKQEAIATEMFRLADRIKVFLVRLNLLAQKKVYKHSDLLADVAADLRDRDLQRTKSNHEQKTLVASLDNIRNKRTYLLSTVSAYRESLLSARAVGFNPPQVELGIIGSCCGRPTMQREYKIGPHRYSYIELESQGFILKSELPEQFRPHLTFVFESLTPGTIRLSVVAKQAAAAGMGERDSSIFNAQLLVEDLLEAKEKKIAELNLVELILDLTQVVEIINLHFIR